MNSYKVTTPDGRTISRRSSRPFPYAVLGLPAPYEAEGEIVRSPWHVNFASSLEKAEREAKIQRGYGIETRIVETECETTGA